MVVSLMIGTVLGLSALVALMGAYTHPSVGFGRFEVMRQGLEDAPYIPYIDSKYGISGVQPRGEWLAPETLSGTNNESIQRGDHKVHWGYNLRPSSEQSPSNLVGSILANPLVQHDGTETVSHVTYAGYEAIRLEATLDYRAGGVWREVFYAFVANDATYLIKGGATIAEWNYDGRVVIANLLDSVTVAQQKVVLDPAPWNWP